MKMKLVAIVFATAAGLSHAEELTLDRAVQEALSRNPMVSSAAARRDEAASTVRASRAGRLPQINLSESALRGNNPVYVFGALLEQERFSQSHFDPAFLNDPDALTSHRFAVTVRVPVFDAMQTSTAIVEAASMAGMSEATLEATRQQVILEVIRRYYGVALAGERLSAARASQKAAEQAARAARDRFAQGVIVESDALAAEAQTASFKSQVIAAEGDLAIARASLASLLGRDSGAEIEIARTTRLEAPQAISSDDVEARASANRQEVRIAQLALDAARSRRKGTSYSALPRLDAFGTWGATGGTFSDRSSDYTAGVVLSVPLLDPTRPARTAGASARVRAAEADQVDATDQVKLEARTAWYALRTARENVDVTEAAVRHAEAAAAIVQDRYAEGLTTITEQLRALAALSGARLEHLAARHRAFIAHAELLRATGDLDVQSFQ